MYVPVFNPTQPALTLSSLEENALITFEPSMLDKMCAIWEALSICCGMIG